MFRIVVISAILSQAFALDMILSFPEGLSSDDKRPKIRHEIERIIREQGGRFTGVVFRENDFIRELRKPSVSYEITADAVNPERLRAAFLVAFPDKHVLRDGGTSRSAQQGDAPEPATNENPASPTPPAPDR